MIEAERLHLAEMLGRLEFDIVEIDNDHCCVVIDRFTLHFYWRPGEGLFASSFEIHEPPRHRVDFTNNLHTWLILRSRGEAWPQPERGRLTSTLLKREFHHIAKALPAIIDETALRETLLWEAGYMDGYSAWD